jgi:hypothetical protein
MKSAGCWPHGYAKLDGVADPPQDDAGSACRTAGGDLDLDERHIQFAQPDGGHSLTLPVASPEENEAPPVCGHADANNRDSHEQERTQHHQRGIDEIRHRDHVPMKV